LRLLDKYRAIHLAAGCRCGYKHDGLILPQFVPTNGRWLYAKLAFSNSPGAPGADDIP
jgi:hypothetical protein